MMANKQYILSDYSDNEVDSKIQREGSYFNLQLLYGDKITGIDTSLDNIKDNKSVPTDLAIKRYIQNIPESVYKIKYRLGEVENYYGVYSGYSVDGINAFIRPNNTNTIIPIINTNNPLVVRINNKEKKIVLSSGWSLSDSLISDNIRVILNDDADFNTEKSKYMKSVSFNNISQRVWDSTKKYYILNNNGEYSTVRFDKVNMKLHFEHFGASDRGQWRLQNNSISPINIITNDNLTFELLDIAYIFIAENGQIEYSMKEPVTIGAGSTLTESEKYGYNVVDECWYYHNGTNVVKKNIQWIGMVGIKKSGNQTISICSFSLPNYIKKNQKNTIKLVKINDTTIESESGDNIIVSRDVLHIKNHIFKWNIGSIASYSNQTLYLYIDNYGFEQYSLERPYKNEFGGYYLHNKCWRCVGSIFVNYQGKISAVYDLNGTIEGEQQYPSNPVQSYMVFTPLGFKGKFYVNNVASSLDPDVYIMTNSGNTVKFIGEIDG